MWFTTCGALALMNKWHFIHWKMFSGNEYFQENEWKCDNIIGIFIVVVVVVLVGISLLFLQKGLIFIGILRRHREKLCFYRKMETGFPSKLIIRMISSHGNVLRISFRAKKNTNDSSSRESNEFAKYRWDFYVYRMPKSHQTI